MYRLFFGFLAFILVIVLLVAFVGGSHKRQPSQPLKALPDYAGTSATVTMATDGIVNGDDIHRQIRIIVGKDSRELDVIQGYSGHVIFKHTLYNNRNAYLVFLKAINNEGFLSKNLRPKAGSDSQGQCPVGYRYVFHLSQNGTDLFTSWASTCGQQVGNFNGTLDALQGLFQNQIPNYSTLTQNVNLSATSTR